MKKYLLPLLFAALSFTGYADGRKDVAITRASFPQAFGPGGLGIRVAAPMPAERMVAQFDLTAWGENLHRKQHKTQTAKAVWVFGSKWAGGH